MSVLTGQQRAVKQRPTRQVAPVLGIEMNVLLRYFRGNPASRLFTSLRLLLLLFLPAFGVAAHTPPQPQSPASSATQEETPPQGIQKAPSTIAVQVKTVSLLATVRDKHGKIISDLKKDDFVLEEDGRPRVLPIAEMRFEQWEPLRPRIVGYGAKWDAGSADAVNTVRVFGWDETEPALHARRVVAEQRQPRHRG